MEWADSTQVPEEARTKVSHWDWDDGSIPVRFFAPPAETHLPAQSKGSLKFPRYAPRHKGIDIPQPVLPLVSTTQVVDLSVPFPVQAVLPALFFPLDRTAGVFRLGRDF